MDQFAGEWALLRGIELAEYPADWKGRGRHAALIRNEQMLREGSPDFVVAFPSNRGTSHMCKLATDASVPVLRIAAPRGISD